MSIGRRTFIQQTIAAAAGAQIANAASADATQAQPVQPFTFAVLADPHCAEAPKQGIEHCGNAVEKFARCARVMQEMPHPNRPEFILLVGDIHPWKLAEALPDITIPIHAVAGNHESSPEKRQQLRDLFPGDFMRDGQPRDYYSFVHNGVRFIGLCNAGLGGEHIGQFCSEIIQPRGQCEWLETELSQPESRTIVFAHIPPQPDGVDREMRLNRNDSRWFNALVREKRPTALFFGHLHEATQTYRIGHTRCYNVRSCCWNFRKAFLGFMLVRVAADGIETKEIETGAYT